MTAQARLKLALVGNVTLDLLGDLAASALAGLGLPASIYLGPFDSAASELLDPGSGLARFEPDLVLVHLEARALFPAMIEAPLESGLDEKLAAANRAADDLAGWVAAFRARRPECSLVLSTLAGQPITSLGSLEGLTGHSLRPLFRLFNQRLEELAAGAAGLHLLDCAGLAGSMGFEHWADERCWYLARMPYSLRALRAMAAALAHLAAALRGRTRKVLVLDLDNTLWGGVVGEDGVQGLALDVTGLGKAYRDLQAEALSLSRRGVVLAVSSKNNAADALEVMAGHPHMLLRPERFAALKTDWRDKSTHLEELSRELNLGLDSFVFVDDNPAERLAVRTRLPQVAVLELPEDPTLYARTLRESPLFTQPSLTAEDAKRGEFYASEAGRARLKGAAASLEEYYRSLKMRLRLVRVDAFSLKRLSQLTQRTNQFNLTTRRYSETEMAALAASPGHEVLAAGLGDAFGDNGVVGLCILEKAGPAWLVDTFLLSCRVIGRTFETALLALAASRALAGGAVRLEGRFIPTARNIVAADFYKDHGFSGAGGLWTLDLGAARPALPEWFQLESEEQDHA